MHAVAPQPLTPPPPKKPRPPPKKKTTTTTKKQTIKQRRKTKQNKYMFVVGMMSMQTYQNKHVCHILQDVDFFWTLFRGGYM